jgi:hypothetical protein
MRVSSEDMNDTVANTKKRLVLLCYQQLSCKAFSSFGAAFHFMR